MKIQAAVSRGLSRPLSIEEVDLAQPQRDEVLIRLVASGVCHTDAESINGRGAPFPAVLGHEGSGVVEKVGDGVKGIQVGDHVVLSFSYCGTCDHCLEGWQNACEHTVDLNFGGGLGEQGLSRLSQNGQQLAHFFGQSSFATYTVANQKNVVVVDKDVDLALLGPLGCGFQTGSGTVLNALQPKLGSSIVIFGAGAVGLSAVMAAKIANCGQIIAVDIHDSRLATAKEFGATHVINGKNTDALAEIMTITGGKGAHYSIETTGVSSVVEQSVRCLRVLGTCAIVGIAGDVTLNFFPDVLGTCRTIIGVVEGNALPQKFIPQLIRFYKEGRFPFDKLVKFYDFADINQAFEDSKNGITIKPVVKIAA